jgi:predicted lipoprotein with Yx(FWY)xxD motif
MQRTPSQPAPKSARRRRTPAALSLLAALALALAACGSSGSGSTASTASTGTSTSSSSSSNPYSSSTTSSTSTSTQAPSSATVAVAARSLPALGLVLVDAGGRTLYTFKPDDHAKVTCVGGCAQVWPPLKLKGGQSASAIAGVKSSLLGSDPDPEGGRVVTYGGWPLYTYVADSAAGTASGQGIETNGGLWYVISPSGAVITKKTE